MVEFTVEAYVNDSWKEYNFPLSPKKLLNDFGDEFADDYVDGYYEVYGGGRLIATVRVSQFSIDELNELILRIANFEEYHIPAIETLMCACGFGLDEAVTAIEQGKVIFHNDKSIARIINRGGWLQ